MPSTTSLAHLSLTPRDYDFVTGILAAGGRPRESVETVFLLTQRRWMTVPMEPATGGSATEPDPRRKDGVGSRK